MLVYVDTRYDESGLDPKHSVPETKSQRSYSDRTVFLFCLAALATMPALLLSELTAGLAAMSLTVISLVSLIRFCRRRRRQGLSLLGPDFSVGHLAQTWALAATLAWAVYGMWLDSWLFTGLNVVASFFGVIAVRSELRRRRRDLESDSIETT